MKICGHEVVKASPKEIHQLTFLYDANLYDANLNHIYASKFEHRGNTPFIFGKLATQIEFTDREKETAHLYTI